MNMAHFAFVPMLPNIHRCESSPHALTPPTTHNEPPIAQICDPCNRKYPDACISQSVTKLQTAPRPAPLHATTVERKATSPVTARWRLSPSPATSAARRATSLATALTRLPALADTLVVEVTLNATAAERPATLRVPALSPPLLVTAAAEVATEEVSAEDPRRPATPAAALATCLATASRAPSATTATALATSAGTAPRLRSALATPAARKAISPVTAPVLVLLMPPPELVRCP
ncbi:hypothetical protein FPV67DRAFT_720272 [Lyophyllum atratum]|nr:hypothetical protein FPV67DRAFT_720272 [Lyophyllum atratum]